MHRGYVLAADVYAARTQEIELQLNPSQGGPVVSYERIRAERYKSCWYRLVTIDATFTIVAAPFAVFLIIGILCALRLITSCGVGCQGFA